MQQKKTLPRFRVCARSGITVSSPAKLLLRSGNFSLGRLATRKRLQNTFQSVWMTFCGIKTRVSLEFSDYSWKIQWKRRNCTLSDGQGQSGAQQGGEGALYYSFVFSTVFSRVVNKFQRNSSFDTTESHPNTLESVLESFTSGQTSQRKISTSE